jgi:hypothetical protein
VLVFKQYTFFLAAIAFLLHLFLPLPAVAAPSFFIEGTSSGTFSQVTSWTLKLNTDGQLLTAAQTVIEFDKDLFNQVQINNLNSRCSFWAPADPSLGLGNSVTPYFLNGEKIVVSCGFSNPGYNTSNGIGDRILAFSLEPLYLGTASFTLTDTQFRFVDAIIAPGTPSLFEYLVSSTESAATPSPTPVPTPTPQPPPTQTLRASDLNFVDITSTSSGTSTTTSPTSTSSSTTSVPLDDSIPPPPDDLEPREAATPYPMLSANQLDPEEEGDVLSIQSLRELLIPGKSDADRRLVVFNLMVILMFLFLLAILVWRLILAKRTHDLKIKHMNELIEGELSVIQSKVQATKTGQGSSDDVVQSLEELKQELDKKENT